jgi:hypothetical protein
LAVWVASHIICLTQLGNSHRINDFLILNAAGTLILVAYAWDLVKHDTARP